MAAATRYPAAGVAASAYATQRRCVQEPILHAGRQVRPSDQLQHVTIEIELPNGDQVNQRYTNIILQKRGHFGDEGTPVNAVVQGWR